MPGPQDPNDQIVQNLFGAPQGVSGQQILQQGESDAKMIERERPDPPQQRKALVKAWGAEVKHAKKHWKPAFERMKEDQDFCLGKQWSKNPKEKRYVANITLREVTQRILARDGYNVITAVNGRDAVEVASRHRGNIELLVTDVVMPQMAGREAAEQIRALYPAAKVLFMSGYAAGALDTGGILEAGVNLIEKPFNGASLLAKLHEIMSDTG